MRPAEVCGWLRKPARSRAASSLRTVEALHSTSPRPAIAREPTGRPVSRWASMTIPNTCCWRSLSTTGILGRGRDRPARQALGELELRFGVADDLVAVLLGDRVDDHLLAVGLLD